LLNQFIDIGTNLDIESFKIELLISNNNSDDDTEIVVSSSKPKLESCGYKISYFLQAINTGLDGNTKFVFENAKGEYVWFFGDDDILFQEELVRLIEDIQNISPSVCLSSFIPLSYYDENNRVFSKNKVFSLPHEAIPALVKFPKITMYVIKKEALKNKNYNDLINACKGKYYLFVVYAVLAYIEDGTVLVRAENIAREDEDSLQLRYSPTVFSGLYESLELVFTNIDKLNYLAFINKITNSTMMKYILSFLYMHYRNKITLPNDILENDQRYLQINLKDIFLSCANVKLFLKLLVALVIFSVHSNYKVKKVKT
jgi:glycosyltransferase involved in cell wall biosynthesis